MIQKVIEYLEKLLKEKPCFTGSVELNWKDGVLMDIVERKRTKL
jgi:hypothetical protein